jgi:hypothetical protein
MWAALNARSLPFKTMTFAPLPLYLTKQSPIYVIPAAAAFHPQGMTEHHFEPLAVALTGFNQIQAVVPI